MSYVYRFISTEGKVIYIGKTINIHNRMKQHFRAGHLPLECYKSCARIEYQKYKTESDSLIMETYYITKYNPKFNQLQKSRDIPCIEFDEKKWKIYKELQPIQITEPCKISKRFRISLVSIYLLALAIYFLKNVFNI